MKAKDIFEASKTITTEKMNAKRGQITESQFLTSKYLKKLHETPSDNDQIKRYRG